MGLTITTYFLPRLTFQRKGQGILDNLASTGRPAGFGQFAWKIELVSREFLLGFVNLSMKTHQKPPDEGACDKKIKKLILLSELTQDTLTVKIHDPFQF